MTVSGGNAVGGGVMNAADRVTVKEIALALSVPERTAQHQAKVGGWPYDEDTLPTGAKRRLYPVALLPIEVRDALAARALATAVPAPPPAPTEAERRQALTAQGETPHQLEGWQRDIRDARISILHEVDQIALRCRFKRGRAVGHMVALAAKGELPAELMALIRVANARSGAERGKGDRTLGRTSLYRWFKLRDEQGADALAPKAPPKPTQTQGEKTWWHWPFLNEYGRPQKPSARASLEKMGTKFPDAYLADFAKAKIAAEVARLPSYDQIRRYLDSLSEVEKARGRVGARELRQMKCYAVRDVSNLWPGAVYSSDGHTFDAEVEHPRHGQPFRPEVTTVIDIYTRRITGWSANVVEKTESVADALMHACKTAGIPDIWYIDRGKGFNNEAWDHDVTGILARLAIFKENSLPYNSQARGVVERSHQSLWVRAAKELVTYMGAAMDRQARQAVFKATRAEIKRFGKSGLMLTWEAFLAFLAGQVDAYNNRPHSTLPKIRDAETGELRHMTPNEAWAVGVAEHGVPDRLEETEALAAFRPQEIRDTHRGMVSLFGNSYFHRTLEPYHDKQVKVSYDIHDARQVWVYAITGHFICQAEFEGNKQAYFPVTKASLDERRRTEGRLRRNDAHRDEILAEAGPGLVIDHQPAEIFSPAQMQAAEAEYARLEARSAEPVPCAVATPGERPDRFADDASWARWVLENPQAALDEDRRELRRKLRDRNFRMLLEMQGLDVGALSALAA